MSVRASASGSSPDDLQRVVSAALARAGLKLDGARAETVGDIATFRLDPNDPAFAKEPGWQDTFDDLRERPRKRGERIGEWRKRVPIRAIAFEPPRLPDGRDAPEIVQVHLEHRLVRRLLSRFLSQGFQAGLSRISVIEGPGAQPRVVLMGRLAVYGAGAARLHEEIIPVTAIWTEAERERKPLRPLGESGEERTLNQLEDALRHARAAPKMAVARIQALVERDIADLAPAFERIANERLAKVKVELAKRGETEAKLLAELLEQQRKRIAKANAEFDPNQLLLPGIARRRAPRARGRPSPLAEPARAPRKRNPRRAGAHPRLLQCACAPAGAGRPRLSLAVVRVTRMAAELKRDPDLEWLDYVRPVGLVVAPVLLKELGLAPSRQTQADTAVVAAHVGDDSSQAGV